MKKLNALFLVILLTVFTATAQYNTSWSWVKLTTANKAYSLTPDQSGHYTFSGRFSGDAYFDSLNITTDPRKFNGFFVRYDSNGNVLWVKQLGDTSTFVVDQVRTAIDSLGNIYIAGTFNGRLQIDSVVLESRAIQEIFLIKLKSNGKLDWAKQMGTEPLPIIPGPQQPMVQCDGITLDPAGNCYITGIFPDSLNIDSVRLSGIGYNMFVAKFSPQGQLSWAKRSTSGNMVNTNGFTSDSQGNCIVGGIFSNTFTFNGDTLHNNKSTAFIIKVDSSGQNVWAKKINGYTSCNALTVDPADNIYLTGAFRDSAYFYPTPFYSNNNSDAYIAKFDNLGNFVWAIQDSGAYSAWGTAIYADNQHVYVAGTFNGSAFTNTSYAISAHPANSEIFMALLDATQGQPLSVIRPGTGRGEIIALHADSAMNVYVAGNSVNGSTLAGVLLNGGFYLAKLSYSRVSGLAEAANNVSQSIYPNPATEQATIMLSGYNQEVELELVDVTGRKVTVPVQQSLQAESQQLQLNTSSLPKGLYLYRLLDKGTLVATGKLVKD